MTVRWEEHFPSCVERSVSPVFVRGPIWLHRRAGSPFSWLLEAGSGGARGFRVVTAEPDSVWDRSSQGGCVGGSLGQDGLAVEATPSFWRAGSGGCERVPAHILRELDGPRRRHLRILKPLCHPQGCLPGEEGVGAGEGHGRQRGAAQPAAAGEPPAGAPVRGAPAAPRTSPGRVVAAATVRLAPGSVPPPAAGCQLRRRCRGPPSRLRHLAPSACHASSPRPRGGSRGRHRGASQEHGGPAPTWRLVEAA